MRHHMPRLGEYWPSYWNSKMDLRRQFEFLTAMHVSTMPFIFRFFCGRATINHISPPTWPNTANEVALESPRRARRHETRGFGGSGDYGLRLAGQLHA